MPAKYRDIIVIGDAHVAGMWDRIARLFPQKKDFLNPNGMLRQLAKKIKSNQLLVTNGDMVDYYFSDYFPSGNNNLDLVEEILSSVKAPILQNPGNHEYRSWAYNIRLPGLQNVNLAREFVEKHREKLGHHLFRALTELKSINMFHTRHDLTASEFLKKNHAETIDGRRLIFMDTGPDAATTWGMFWRVKYWPYLFKLEPPPSYGFTRRQVRYLQAQLDQRPEEEVILFVHCPPFFSRKEGSQIDLVAKNILRQVHQSAFGACVFARGMDKLMQMILDSNKNILVVSSHVHSPGQALLNKKTRRLSSVPMIEINKTMKDKGIIKFVTTLPLGGLSPFNRKAGYLKIKGHRLEQVVVKDFTKKKVGL